MTIEFIEPVYEAYGQEDKKMFRFFLNDVSEKPLGKLKQRKIILPLTDWISSMLNICSEN